MSDFTRVYFSIDGVNLNDPGDRWHLGRATKRRALPDVRGISVSTPARHGQVFIPGAPYAPSTMALSLIVTDRDSVGVPGGPVQAEANLEQLFALLSSPSRLFRIEHHVSTTVSRVAYGEVTASADPELLGFRADLYRLALIVTVPGVFWSDGSGPKVVQGPASTASGTLALPALSGGSAPVTDAIVRLLGPFNGKASVTDQRSGTGLSWQGTLPTSQYLYLNATTLKAHTSTSATAWTAGTDVSANLDYPPVGPLQLTPTVTVTGTTYSLAYVLPAANTSPSAVGVRAERKFL